MYLQAYLLDVYKTFHQFGGVDCLLTLKRFGKSGLSKQLVEKTWEEVLAGKDNLLDCWIREDGVLVGIRTGNGYLIAGERKEGDARVGVPQAVPKYGLQGGDFVTSPKDAHSTKQTKIPNIPFPHHEFFHP
ncbi:hypothetical protein BT96DRAFT_940360 [Gymnopus androsaceus JB14]|uniref:Uncharacterized protein n=1 Tax=Gymnopus androsaceus JB14 TaxID=1447944 RepID=A0A6A4HJR7_9AGAR|nr:hypothetical protein BT96DRAFT_940360 [Gymnopus androsaceus JB14]